MADSNSLSARIQEAADAISGHAPDWRPEIGLILGSGLGELADEIENPVRIPYSQIPHMPISTVHGHAGQLVLGTLEGKPVMACQGRVHFYEGYDMEQITFPVRLMRALGAHTLLCTNAVGGMNDELMPGDLVVIRDHINYMGVNPLRGENDDNLGPRFPPMDDAYDFHLRELAHDCAKKLGFRLRDVVYLALSGPSYETKAEIKFFRTIGADTVGMSTAPEVIIARHGGMRVVAISCVTNALHGSYHEADHESVVKQAKESGPRFKSLLRAIIEKMPAPTAAAR